MNLEEVRRLRKLRSYDILDTPPEPQFDDIALLVSTICETPVGLVSFADRDRHWYKARVGVDVEEVSNDVAICSHAIGGDDFLIIRDLATDERTRDSPLVTETPFLRFYASVLLGSADGQTIGTLCAIDFEPRASGLTAAQKDALAALARHTMALLWLRVSVAGKRGAQR